MDGKHFWLILGLGISLVVVQAISSWTDGFLMQSQMRSRGITNGWSFMEHGGMWADVFAISPVVAYAASRYRLNYFSNWGIVILAPAIVLSVAMGNVYRKNGIVTPEAHTHDGRVTLAGWIHGMFAVVAIWICALVYLNMTTPAASRMEIIVFSFLLTPFFYLGVVKMSRKWVFSSVAKTQVVIGIICLWSMTILRLWRA